MKRIFGRVTLYLGVCLTVIGCESAFGPEPEDSAVSELSAVRGETLQKNGVVHSVTGTVHHFDHGDFHTLTNSLIKHADGTVSGQIQSIARNSGLFIHAVPVCLRVEGNKAWGAVVVTNSNVPQLVGLGFGQAVIDNGQGAHAPADRFSGPFGPIGNAAAWCDNPVPDVDPFFRDIERGNLQVR